MHLPLSAFKANTLLKASTPSIFLSRGGRTGAYLIVDRAEPAVLALDGQMKGFGGIRSRCLDEEGIEISNIHFEVDIESKFKPSYDSRPLGSIICDGKGFSVTIGGLNTLSHEEAYDYALDQNAADYTLRSACGFSRWKAIMVLHDRSEVIWTFEASTFARSD